MDRLKFFIFSPRQVRCFNCKVEGQSVIYKPAIYSFIGMVAIAAVFTWLTGMIPGFPSPILIGSYFGPKYTPFMVGTWWLVALSMLFTQKAHRCSACGSEYLKPL